ncbi:MAG: alanine--tRNA ligase-related protein [Desulfobacterales bacterium]
MTGDEIRKIFFDYFKGKITRSCGAPSVVLQDDPNSRHQRGMVQFKRTFLGEERRDYTWAVTAQKCIRAGGKHNDL